MNKCRYCQIEILDAAGHCPLCRSALDAGNKAEPMYPDLRIKTRKLALACRIYLFCAIRFKLAHLAAYILLCFIC